MKTIILASRNKDKIVELRAALQSLNIELKSSLDFPFLQEVEEDRKTLKGNALKKAKYTHLKTGLPALADDTGLEVDALDGQPGVYSARFAGENANYQENVGKLLKEMADIPSKKRIGQFRTVAAYVTNEGVNTFEGICRGKITEAEKGSGGFGYDPVFQPEGYKKTFAELDAETKNEISHRGKAIHKFVKWLKNSWQRRI